MSEITEVFIWKVIAVNIVYYDGAWTYGEESGEKTPALSLQITNFIINGLIFMLLTLCDFVQKKKKRKNNLVKWSYVV